MIRRLVDWFCGRDLEKPSEWVQSFTTEMRARTEQYTQAEERRKYQARRDCEAWEFAEEDLREEEAVQSLAAERLAVERKLENTAILLCGNIIKFYRESGRPVTPNSVARVTAAMTLGALMNFPTEGGAL